ncbi:MAG: 4Fe-4S dicluster domain-containing protein [Deltaproteobacteria bacterium]|jgi:ferredoxin|nr:4Fe-4S dicluster domain-containing protein [Deltaproteobacteria bacterium]MBW1748725.1 4Fe-4S dicluster domain-containing protein [Deltaproteobacteria bacterium]MBW1969143.1 4Fe-4S dicluster domain-containing protein [Deltaproteobacteria bacterium]MBW2156495.1 4Fe-4S dicluster domain-containing protein [Deltaproteobacteria bacterium]MBW2226370.1 4Fe-4S dicluster domain-containing protein [Deltaproteobacteria bacterium]
MKQMKLVLIFPETIVEEPITYHLISDYGIRVNILRASIDPGKQGRMVVELSGEEIPLSQGLNYLERVGVQVTPLAQEIRHLEDRCASCTSCVPHCPTQALDVDRESWKVSFDPEKCIVCLSCLETCIYQAMSVEERFV